MHGVHQSRGRIFFEVLCALAVSLSCVGTWVQTGATAILPAAAAALLYGLVRAFDMVRRRPTADAQPTEAVVAETLEPVAAVEPAARQSKAPRKAGGRRKSAPKAAKAAELTLVDEVVVAEPAPAQEATVVELVPEEKLAPAPVTPMPVEEVAHASLAPLFEPEPFVRQQRTVFGRKSGRG